MSIKILCRKIPNIIIKKNNNFLKNDRFFEYCNTLTKNVRNQNGFINSETYYDQFLCIDNEKLSSVLTISEWKNYNSWNEWYESNKRNKIKNKYNDIIDDEIISILRKDFDDEVFLL